MRPKSPAEDGEEDLFRSRLANILDPRHELLRLAALIDWGVLDAAFGPLYAEAGRPGLPTRLMAGLHLLKHAKGLSDEQVCAQWVENPYFQAFCGETWFRHRLPLDRSSMTRWRHRVGPERLEAVLAETIAAAKRAGAMGEKHARRVTIDTPSTPRCRPRRWPTRPTAICCTPAYAGSAAWRAGTACGCASPSSAWRRGPGARRRG